MWDLIVSVPDRCLSFYFSQNIGLTYFHFPTLSFCVVKQPYEQNIWRAA